MVSYLWSFGKVEKGGKREVKMDGLTGNKNGISSFTRFGDIGFEARVDLVGRCPCYKKPGEGEEDVESHG